jgi:hypothetical protein
MSRRQHTTLILQVRIPVPVGHTQAQTHNAVKRILTESSLVVSEAGPFISPQTQVKLLGRETTYL